MYIYIYTCYMKTYIIYIYTHTHGRLGIRVRRKSQSGLFVFKGSR